ncbi:MAG: 2-C-methyl-D-erythritol 4-phosphate cytidylyltransferase [Bryobacterales bacterium]|nr:2-C-methyl-D-erythritol 4-phosphate cytidylyltransferase [Bryobacterales bacterium]
MKVSVILPAAGLGTRMAVAPGAIPTERKQFLLLRGSPVLVHTLRRFNACPSVTEIVVALRPEDIPGFEQMLRDEDFAKPVRAVAGGESRQESVFNALRSLGEDVDLVAVHDAVRPLVSVDQIDQVIQKAAATGAAILGIVPVDTVKQVHLHEVRTTIPRERLVLAQTPQVFRVELLREAFERAIADGFIGTDEASLVERLETTPVSVVAGSEWNIKITRSADLVLAEFLLTREERDTSQQGLSA